MNAKLVSNTPITPAGKYCYNQYHCHDVQAAVQVRQQLHDALHDASRQHARQLHLQLRTEQMTAAALRRQVCAERQTLHFDTFLLGTCCWPCLVTRVAGSMS